ncbi:MAG: riboflavin synthase [Candidatus Hydrogenedentes bacterium]|nr:riboflavin synthase [Candidatus Hydrogenedentota bacterium]
MFTGIIEEVGAISRRSGAELEIMAEAVLEELKLGDSVAVDGACLTVASLLPRSFVVQVSPETFSKTTLGALQVGHAVNLERALAFGDRLGGHLVQGHVDGVGRVDRVVDQGEFQLWRFNAPETVAPYLVPKGSVTIDGISLTIVDPQGDSFAVAIIPETLKRTKLSTKRAGDAVNMEADMMGKHIYHYLRAGRETGLTVEVLKRCGFA